VSSPERGAPGIFFQTQPDGPNQRAAGLDELESPARPWTKKVTVAEESWDFFFFTGRSI
jgi:hypothetical protein